MRYVPLKIKAELKERHLNVTEAAELLGTSRSNLSNILCGIRSLSINLALKMEQTLHLNAESLLHAQLTEDITIVREAQLKRER